MVMIQRGKVQGKSIVLSQALALPDGTDVVVTLEPVPSAEEVADALPEKGKVVDLPFFGMWADRDHMADSVAWVRQERGRSLQRSLRQD